MEFMCPEEFRDGVNTVSCKVNVTAVKDADCSSLQPFVTFHLTVNSFRTLKCKIRHFDFTTCFQDKELNASDCWCNESDGEIFDYTFSYKANHTQDVGAKMECGLCTLPKKYLDLQINHNCNSLRFGE